MWKSAAADGEGVGGCPQKQWTSNQETRLVGHLILLSVAGLRPINSGHFKRATEDRTQSETCSSIHTGYDHTRQKDLSRVWSWQKNKVKKDAV